MRWNNELVFDPNGDPIVLGYKDPNGGSPLPLSSPGTYTPLNSAGKPQFTPNQTAVYSALRDYMNGVQPPPITKFEVRTKRMDDMGTNFEKGKDVLSHIQQEVQVFTNTNATTVGEPQILNY